MHAGVNSQERTCQKLEAARALRRGFAVKFSKMALCSQMGKRHILMGMLSQAVSLLCLVNKHGLMCLLGLSMQMGPVWTEAHLAGWQADSRSAGRLRLVLWVAC